MARRVMDQIVEHGHVRRWVCRSAPRSLFSPKWRATGCRSADPHWA
jgi:hypothetical protein